MMNGLMARSRRRQRNPDLIGGIKVTRFLSLQSTNMNCNKSKCESKFTNSSFFVPERMESNGIHIHCCENLVKYWFICKLSERGKNMKNASASWCQQLHIFTAIPPGFYIQPHPSHHFSAQTGWWIVVWRRKNSRTFSTWLSTKFTKLFVSLNFRLPNSSTSAHQSK